MDKLILGTWLIGESQEKYSREVNAILYAIDNGITHIDTAEIYGDGLSESLIGEAIRGYERERLTIFSKVHPKNCNRESIYKSVEDSLKRLNIDYLDYYLLHWITEDTDFKETILLMEELKRQKLIRNWGVSNFDTDDMKELLSIPGGENCKTNQVLFNLAYRGIEYDLLPYLNSIKIPVMAYCALAHGLSLYSGLNESKALKKIAEKHEKTVHQIMFNFVVSTPGVHGIAKSVTKKHLDEIIAALDIKLDNDDYNLLNSEYPVPTTKVQLETV